jgi:hypothetical protein
MPLGRTYVLACLKRYFGRFFRFLLGQPSKQLFPRQARDIEGKKFFAQERFYYSSTSAHIISILRSLLTVLTTRRLKNY